MFAPKGTPPAAIAILNKAVNAALPGLKDKMTLKAPTRSAAAPSVRCASPPGTGEVERPWSGMKMGAKAE